MSDLLLSVLMPAYNAEKFIGEAIESVQHQTYGNWELNIVDDCSTDQTAQIVNKYRKEDPRIHYSKLSVNSGNPYVPRNEAARLSKGEFLIHLDSDDYLEKDYFEKFVSRQIETDADGILGVMHLVSETGEPLNQSIPKAEFDLQLVITGKEAFQKTVPWKIGLNGAGFRREIVLKAIEQHKVYTHGAWCDEVLSRMFLLNSQKIAFTRAMYMYRVNSTSLVHTFSPKLFDMCQAAKDVRRLCNENFPEDHEILVNGEMYVYGYFSHVINQYIQGKCKLSQNQRDDFKNKLKSIYEELDISIIKKRIGIISKFFVTNGFELYYITKQFRIWIHSIKNTFVRSL